MVGKITHTDQYDFGGSFMKKTKISLLCLFLAAAVACSASACGNGGGATESLSTPQGSTQSSVVSEIQSSISSSNPTEESVTAVDSSTTGTFDFDEVCKDIEINGKKYTFPFSLKDLGEGFTYEDILFSKKSKEAQVCEATIDVYYNGKHLFDAHIGNMSNDYFNKEDMIYDIPITSFSQNNYISDMKNNTNFIKIAGISIGDTPENVVGKLGKNYDIIYSDNGKIGNIIYYKGASENVSVSFIFDEETGKVNYIWLADEDF